VVKVSYVDSSENVVADGLSRRQPTAAWKNFEVWKSSLPSYLPQPVVDSVSVWRTGGTVADIPDVWDLGRTHLDEVAAASGGAVWIDPHWGTMEKVIAHVMSRRWTAYVRVPLHGVCQLSEALWGRATRRSKIYVDKRERTGVILFMGGVLQ